MSFKLPSIRKNSVPTIISKNNIPRFQIEGVKELRQLGSGSFGSVILVRRTNNQQAVVKKIKKEDEEDNRQQRLFYKEAAILNNVNHKNVVKFLGICTKPCALMLEYLCFDFKPFGGSATVSSLDQYLSYIDDHDLVLEFPFQTLIATDIAKGLEYLHSNDVVHRDLKPGNILVSNTHYSELRGSQMEEAFKTSPIKCKLTDFGESRSEAAQTATLRHQATANVYRGSPAYMAPEIFSEASNKFVASMNDLQLVDIWALGMVLFIILNPDLEYPYYLDIQRAKRHGEKWREVIQSKMSKGELPKGSLKYHTLQATDWFIVSEAMERCLSYMPKNRPSAREISHLLERDFDIPCRNISLMCSQSTAIEELHARLVDGCDKEIVSIDNDGTNSCTFLAVLLADVLISDGEELPTQIDEWEELAQKVSVIIMKAPRKFNHLRDINRKYDVLEAYGRLRDGKLTKPGYEFTEEILTANRMYSPEGRRALIDGITRLFTVDDVPGVALYTCGGYTFLIGCKNGKFFLIDTHRISSSLGGNGNGILKVYPNEKESAKRVCCWIWKRLKDSGVDETNLQSLSIVDPPRYAVIVIKCDKLY